MVDTDLKLASILPVIEEAKWVAVDTEADSLHAYPEKVCLIQISTPAGENLIDPLGAMNLDGLLKALATHELIMHGADYDLRLLNKHHQFKPLRVFDTMIAARLLGVKQFGLGDLVQQFLGVKLEKGPQKANWAMRPLTDRMICYARNDTRYLKPLADHLEQELLAKGRLAWQRESCARLVEECAQNGKADPEQSWRLKGSQALDRRGLAILREVWRWREKEARAANRPPFFVFSHDALMAVAAAAVQGNPVDSLLPRHLSERRRAGILKAVQHALELPPDHWPKQVRHVFRRQTEGEKRRYQEIRRRRDYQAASLGLDAALIASRSTIADLAHNWEKHAPELMRWQRALLETDSAVKPEPNTSAALISPTHTQSL